MGGNLRLNRTLWILNGVLAFAAAAGGVIKRDIYTGLFPKDFLPGAFPQDILTMLTSVLLVLLALGTRAGDVRKQVVITGLIGSLFYLYGIFTIERVYNGLYLLYAAIFALSFWTLISTLAKVRSASFSKLRVPKAILKTTAVTSIIIAGVFTVLWTAALIPLMRDHHRIEFMYSIYILDLCFIMPAFVITAVMSLRGMPLGILMGPAIMILGFFVIFPLGLNELAKPSWGMPINVAPMVVSFAFAAAMLTIGGLQIGKMHVD